MLQPIRTTRFKKDVKRLAKRGKKLDKLRVVIEKLLNQEVLEQKYRDHILIGNYVGRRECHIEPDWLLIYETIQDGIIFERTGSHSDLFK